MHTRTSRVIARPGISLNTDPQLAVDELARQVGADAAALDALLFFCSPDYDLDALGQALRARFACPVVGCTSAGQISPLGFQRGGLSGLGLSGGALRLQPQLIHPLSECELQAQQLAADLHAAQAAGAVSEQLFALLLIDGVSMMEERVTAALYQALGNVPLVGGSAGDDLRFEKTHVYHDGRFLQDAAVLTLFECATPFSLLKLQHFVPTEQRLVITDADPEQRIIREINGEPAAAAYAELIGVDPDLLDATLFSQHPLMLKLGDDYYIRSIQQLLPDQSLKCACAIDVGLVVSIGRSVDALATLKSAFGSLHEEIGEPALVIGSDCILRRLEFEQTGQDGEVGALLAANRVFGFSTYGEQYNGVHVNQTFTGIAIGT